MAINTYLLHFEVERQKLTVGYNAVEEKMTEILGEYVSGLSVIHSLRMGDGGFLTLYTGHRESFVTVRAPGEGIAITVNIEHYKKGDEDDLIPCKRYSSMSDEMAAALESERYQRFPIVQRGTIKRYFLTTDKRLMELDIDKVLFEEKSPYQHVQVSHSFSLGNILILDGQTNLAVKDVVYTETMMQQGKENYQDKEIIILGGGDGALMYELLKEDPKSVLMLELDEVVIRACQQHMREVNGGVLDIMKGQNYEIIIGDCMEYLQKMLKKDRQFDYVFGDLTDLAYAEENCNPGTGISAWSFIKDVVNLSFKVLKPTGKYMCHCAGTVRPDHLKSFEDNLKELDEPVEFSTDVAFVPSFMEFWQFYQIWRKNSKV